MKALERGFVAANRWLLIGLLLVMACTVFANVLLRYTTGDSLAWAEEVARYLMAWVTFLGAGLVFRFGGHVAIDNLHAAVGPGRARSIRGIVMAGVGIFCLVMAYHAALYTWATRFQTTAATEISIAWVYLAMPVGFVLFFLHLLLVARRYIASGQFEASDEMDAEAAAAL